MAKIRVYRVTLNTSGILIEWDFMDSCKALNFMEKAFDTMTTPQNAHYTLSIEEKEDDF